MLKRICLIFVLFAFPAKVTAQESYLVAYAGFAGFQAPVWAAKDLGLFSKYGFNGDVVLVPGSVRQVQAIVGGSIHFAQVNAATGVNAINQGLDLVMISGTLNLEIVQQRNPAVKVNMNPGRYLDESTLDELEREGFFNRLAGK